MVRRPDPIPAARVLERVDAVADGAHATDTVPTGFPSVDRILGGGPRHGDLIVLAGDVGSGKSSLALAFALRAAMAGTPTAFFSSEMSVERLLERALAVEGRARVDDMRRGALDEMTRVSLGVAAIRLRDGSPHFSVLPVGGIEALRDDVRRVPRPRFLVVDALQALVPSQRPLDEELAAAVRGLKQLALELDLALVVTAHLPHFERGRANLRPQLDDLGALGAVKQHADAVLGLFREEMYTFPVGIEGATELHVLKNRSGATGYVDLYFYKQWMRFEDMLDPDR
ncbi:MAG: AAA family ATPase [Gemmatimonadetes bacterium]|nr:AAA family ATPase [Gemmatimonadota bacterium]